STPVYGHVRLRGAAVRAGGSARRAGDPLPRPGDAAPRRARADGGRRRRRRRRRRGRHPRRGPRRAPRRRRVPLRLPCQVRRHACADAGLLRLHRAALPPPAPRRQASRPIRQHRHPGRRPRNHRLDGDHAAGAPRDAVRADRVHLRGGDVGDGRAPRRVAVRRGRLLRRRLQAAVRARAGPRRAPRQVHGHTCQENGARCLV
uniref:Uncharacterized protein n=1 Tax=Oryza barthii TaxID=65489 RepID=A0A0D3FP26_9ORYZ